MGMATAGSAICMPRGVVVYRQVQDKSHALFGKRLFVDYAGQTDASYLGGRPAATHGRRSMVAIRPNPNDPIVNYGAKLE